MKLTFIKYQFPEFVTLFWQCVYLIRSGIISSGSANRIERKGKTERDPLEVEKWKAPRCLLWISSVFKDAD